LTPIAQRPAERAEKVDVAVVRRGGLSEVRLAYRVVRDVPLTGGLAVTLETVPATKGSGRDAIEALERICAVAGYDGIANGEFCVGADGSTTLIEVNARPWASMWFAERLGQRVAERCVRHAAGVEPLPPAPPPRHRRYHHVVGELQWASLHDRVAPRLGSLLATTRPWDVFEYDDLGDPWPILRHAVRRAPG
jgi:predicted ATP-grasp superfamily ATP-dependent carboligase